MKRDLFNNKNNNIKIDQDILEIKLDKQVEQTLKDLHAKGFKEARKIDVLVICFQDAYVNKISKNNATVNSNIKKSVVIKIVY